MSGGVSVPGSAPGFNALGLRAEPDIDGAIPTGVAVDGAVVENGGFDGRSLIDDT
jgi:hypothetical protein